MSFFRFSKIGESYAKNWGSTVPETNIDNYIKRENDERLQMCLMAALVEQNNAIISLLSAIRSNTKQQKPEPDTSDLLSVGYCEALRQALELSDIPERYSLMLLSKLDQSGLSVRARKTLCRLSLSLNREAVVLGDVTRENLEVIRNCGVGTIRELLDWKLQQAWSLNNAFPNPDDVAGNAGHG